MDFIDKSELIPDSDWYGQYFIRWIDQSSRMNRLFHLLVLVLCIVACGWSVAAETADMWFDEGLNYYIAGNYQEAALAFNRSVMINPDYAPAWHARGLALCDLLLYEDAIDSFTRATRIDPLYASAWIAKGDALLRLHQYEDAVCAYDGGISLEPGNEMAWYGRGAALADLGENERAIESFDRALEIDPGNAEIQTIRDFVITRVSSEVHPDCSDTGGVTFAGGDGSSREAAVIILGAESTMEGVIAESYWISQNYGAIDTGWEKGVQYLLSDDLKQYDLQEVILKESGEVIEVWFDISDFFGKPVFP